MMSLQALCNRSVLQQIMQAAYANVLPIVGRVAITVTGTITASVYISTVIIWSQLLSA